VFVHDSGYGLCERRRRLAVNAFAGKNTFTRLSLTVKLYYHDVCLQDRKIRSWL